MGTSEHGAFVEPSDESLCRQVARREPGAFDLLVERYQERAYRIAWSVLRDREEAKDCSQEAFIRLHQSAASFAGDAKFSTWFYRILVNCCLDSRRRHKGWRQVLGWSAEDRRDRPESDPLERLAAPFTDPAETLEAERRMNRLWIAVEELSPQQRAAVLLQCREGLLTKEVAAVLNVSEATVRVHLHRAFTTLRHRVEDAGSKRAQ